MGRNIDDLHPTIKRGFLELQKRMKEKGYNLSTCSTYRSFEEQEKIYAQGRTAPGKIISYAKPGQSMHNYRLAFDIFQNVKGKEWDADFMNTAGQIWTEMGGEWGGNWKSFRDTPHCEWTNGLTLKQLQNGETVPDNAIMPWETAKPKKQKLIDEIAPPPRPPADDRICIIINGQEKYVEAIQKDDLNFVQLRAYTQAIAECLGVECVIEWNDIDKTILVKIEQGGGMICPTN